MAKYGTVSATLQCSECDFLFVIQRKRGRQKPSGHIKHMHCMKCDNIQPFIEVKEHEYDKKIQFWVTYHLSREINASSANVMIENQATGGR